MKEKIKVPSFFTRYKAIWISENFQNLILSSYVETGRDRGEQSINSSDLQDIRPGIKAEELVFQDVDDFLEVLAGLIQDQMNGEDGRLLNDSSANYFFLRGKDEKYYSILVRWEQAQKLWRCGVYLQKELKLPNIRVFRPA